MTTSSESVTVLGVLLDLTLSCGECVEPGQTVHETVKSLWSTLVNQVDKDFKPETTDLPSATQVFLGEINPFVDFKILMLNALSPESNLTDASQSTFPALATANLTKMYLVMFGMPNSWSYYDSYIGEVLKRNKENVVAGMANLSLNDDERSGKLAGGSKKQNGE